MLGLSNRGQHKKLTVPSRPIRAAVQLGGGLLVFYGRPRFLRFAKRPSIDNGPEPPKTRAARHAR